MRFIPYVFIVTLGVVVIDSSSVPATACSREVSPDTLLLPIAQSTVGADPVIQGFTGTSLLDEAGDVILLEEVDDYPLLQALSRTPLRTFRPSSALADGEYRVQMGGTTSRTFFVDASLPPQAPADIVDGALSLGLDDNGLDGDGCDALSCARGDQSFVNLTLILDENSEAPESTEAFLVETTIDGDPHTWLVARVSGPQAPSTTVRRIDGGVGGVPRFGGGATTCVSARSVAGDGTLGTSFDLGCVVGSASDERAEEFDGGCVSGSRWRPARQALFWLLVLLLATSYLRRRRAYED